MLVLKRRAKEGFRINDDIRVEVLFVGQTRVTIGISAPPDTRILRDELVEHEPDNLAAAHALGAERLGHGPIIP